MCFSWLLPSNWSDNCDAKYLHLYRRKSFLPAPSRGIMPAGTLSGLQHSSCAWNRDISATEMAYAAPNPWVSLSTDVRHQDFETHSPGKWQPHRNGSAAVFLVMPTILNVPLCELRIRDKLKPTLLAHDPASQWLHLWSVWGGWCHTRELLTTLNWNRTECAINMAICIAIIYML